MPRVVSDLLEGPIKSANGMVRPCFWPAGKRSLPGAPTSRSMLLRQSVFAYGLDDRSGLPVSRSTGTETCSWTINQLPLILR
jgi:hypothetical protein